MTIYTTGTVSVSNGDAVVTGSGTAWAVALISGGMFSSAGVSVPILSVDSDTSLTLAYAWPGTTATGAVYAIARENSEAADIVDLNDKLSRVLVTLSLAGITPNDSGTIAERDALTLAVGDKGFLFLHAELGYDFEFYRWSGSAWEGPFATRGLTGTGAPGSSDVVGTSATSLAIATGSKSFTVVEVDRGWGVGARLRASSDADGNNFMEGIVTAYSGTSLTINVDHVGGSGTFADWTINLAGEPGAGAVSSVAGLTGTIADVDLRNALKAAPYALALSDIKALDTTKDVIAIYDGDIWDWTSGDFSTQIDTDTVGGAYVKANAVAKTSGAWVRRHSRLTARMFGALASATRAANVTALQCAIAVAQLTGAELFLPEIYPTNSAVTISANIRLTGTSPFTSGITCNSGSAITLVPSTSISNNNQWYGFYNFAAISTDAGAAYGLSYASTSSEFLSNWTMDGCYLSGTTAGANFDSSGSTIGIFSCTLRRNFFANGLRIVDGGDSITIKENTANGNGIGIRVVGLKSGARQLVIRNNNTSTLSECIYLSGVTGAIIEENWAETPSYLGSYTGSSGALVYLSGCTNTRVLRNTIQPLASAGGGFTPAAYAIAIAGTSDGTIINDNDISIGGTGHINISASSVSNSIIGGLNKFDVSRVITDSGTGTVYDPVKGVFDHLVTFTTSTAFATVASYVSTEAGAGNGPFVEAYRNSASPANSDGLGLWAWFGNNASATKTNYAYMGCTALNVAAGAESGRINFATYVAGTLAIRMQVNDGVVIGGGTMPGDGSLNLAGDVQLAGSRLNPAPVTKTASFTLGLGENVVICNGTASITVTLPAAASFPGRRIRIKTIAAFTVVSASSNVVPMTSATAGTAILAATAGKWADLHSDGTNWVIMAGN